MTTLVCLVHGLFLLEGIDRTNGGAEPDLLAVMSHGLAAEGGSDMGLSGNACIESHLNRTEHSLLIVLSDKGEDLHHLPVTPGPLQMALQLPEGVWQVEHTPLLCSTKPSRETSPISGSTPPT